MVSEGKAQSRNLYTHTLQTYIHTQKKTYTHKSILNGLCETSATQRASFCGTHQNNKNMPYTRTSSTTPTQQSAYKQQSIRRNRPIGVPWSAKKKNTITKIEIKILQKSADIRKKTISTHKV